MTSACRSPLRTWSAVRDLFQDAFLGVWRGELEDDGLNGLVLAGGLTGREITVIRAIGRVSAAGRDPIL